MFAPWVLDEIKTVDLNDVRLNRRLREVLAQLAGHPTASIPAACGGYAEMAAAYRLFDNDKVTFQKILDPHIDATRHRIAAQPLVVLVQDTTELDVTRPAQQVAGAGPLDGASRRGVFLHPLHVFTPDGTPLGTLHATVFARDDEDDERLPSSSESRASRKNTPIEDKESYRWLETLRRAQEEALRQPQTQFVCVADSEADIYELLLEGTAESRKLDWIVRACQDRALQPDDDSTAAADHLREQVLAQPVLFTHTVTVRGRTAKVACDKRGRRQPRESRKAQLEVRAARVTLRPPWRPDRKLPPVTVNVVMAREINPPASEPPVEWILLTSLPIDTVEQVRQVLQYYCVRWMIEVFFRTLKSGCRVEERRFERVNRLLPCVAIYMIVAWRTLYVCRMGRECPDMNCEAIFEPAEWKALYHVVHNEAPACEPPKLAEMVRWVAELGGYVNRKRKDPPGPQTIWLGLQRLHDITFCYQLFGPDGEMKTKLVTTRV